MLRNSLVALLLCAGIATAQNTMSQMLNTVTVDPNLNITCATQVTAGGVAVPSATTQQSWYRTFDVSGSFPDADNQGITIPTIELTSVTFGIETLQPGVPSGTIPITIRIYDDPAPDPNLGAVTAQINVPALTLLHEQVVELPEFQVGTKVTVPLVDVNGESTVISYNTAGARLVVGVFVPDLFSASGNALFYAGGNAQGEVLDTFWASPNCGISPLPGVAIPYRALIGNPIPVHIEAQWQDPNSANAIQVRNGTGEGLYLRTGINAQSTSFFDGLTTGPGNNVKTALPADILTVSVGDWVAGGGSLQGTPPVLLAQFFGTGSVPNTPIAAFPEVHIDPNLGGLQVLYDATSSSGAVGPPVFGLTPFTFSYFVPGGLTGISGVIQCLSVANTFNNGFFAASEAHIIVFG